MGNIERYLNENSYAFYILLNIYLASMWLLTSCQDNSFRIILSLISPISVLLPSIVALLMLPHVIVKLNYRINNVKKIYAEIFFGFLVPLGVLIFLLVQMYFYLKDICILFLAIFIVITPMMEFVRGMYLQGKSGAINLKHCLIIRKT